MSIELSNSQSGVQTSNRRSLWEIFRVPVVLGVLSTLGLVSALVGDGGYDWFSWVALGIPVLVIGMYWTGRRRDRR